MAPESTGRRLAGNERGRYESVGRQGGVLGGPIEVRVLAAAEAHLTSLAQGATYLEAENKEFLRLMLDAEWYG